MSQINFKVIGTCFQYNKSVCNDATGTNCINLLNLKLL